MQKFDNLVDLEKSSKMLQNEYLVAKIDVDTAENERRKGRGMGGLKAGRQEAGITLEGSFSAVSKPIFATKYSFFCIF